MNRLKIVRKRVVFLLSCLTLVQVGYAQPMWDFIEIAQRQSLDAKIAKRTLKYSELAYDLYKAGRKPLLALSATPVQYNNDVVQRYSYAEDRTEYRTQQSFFSTINLRLQQQVGFLGGTFYMDSEIKYYRSQGTSRYRQFTTVPIRLGYAQNLLGYNPFKWERRLEPLNYALAERTYIHAMEQVAMEVVSRYFTLALLQEEVNLAQAYVQRCDTLSRLGEEKHKLGRISGTELRRLRLEHTKARGKMLEASKNLKIEQMLFKEFLHLEEEDSLEIRIPRYVPQVDIPLPHAIQCAQAHSSEVLAARKHVIQGEQALDKTKRERYFEASFNASVGWHQLGEDLGQVYRRPLDGQGVSLGLSVPIVDFGRKRMAYQQAKENLERGKLMEEKTQLSLRDEVVASVLKLNLQRDIIQYAEESYALAQETGRAVFTQYALGRGDLSEVSLSITEQLTALVGYYEALKEFWMTYYKIRGLTFYDYEQQRSLCPRTR